MTDDLTQRLRSQAKVSTYIEWGHEAADEIDRLTIALSTFSAREAVLVGALKVFADFAEYFNDLSDKVDFEITYAGCRAEARPKLSDLRRAAAALNNLSSRATDLMAVVEAAEKIKGHQHFCAALGSDYPCSCGHSALYAALARLKSGERG